MWRMRSGDSLDPLDPGDVAGVRCSRLRMATVGTSEAAARELGQKDQNWPSCPWRVTRVPKMQEWRTASSKIIASMAGVVVR